MNTYEKRDTFTHTDYLKTASVFPEEENAYITETAGFVPLEVKLKQFEQNGLIAQFKMSDFDSHDMRELYLNPDFDITPEDDLEEVEEKISALRAYQEEYKKSKVGSFEKTADSPSGSAAVEKLKNDSVEESE